MLVLDTAGQEQWQKEAARQRAASLRDQAILHDIHSNSITVSDDNGTDVSNLLAQMGRPLSAQEVIRRLKIINPSLIFELSIKYPNLYGIYINHQQRNATGGWDTVKTHICGMESGIMPEFSVLHKKKINVVDPDVFSGKQLPRDEKAGWKEIDTFSDETRGWRSVLIRLMKQKLITRYDVQRHFNWLPDRDSKKWHDAIQ